MRIDKDDNIWAIDKGSDMVIKFDQAGRVLMVFGRRKESADAETKPWENVDPPLPAVDGLFRQPTDVAWDSNGNIYITDGYINSRVAKYDQQRRLGEVVGHEGHGPGQFRLPHAIAIDRNNNIYVGDRTNHRIQVFDTDGKFLRMFSIDVPPVPGTKAVNGNTPTGDRLQGAHRRAELDLHHVRAEPGDVRWRDDVPGPRLQGVARWEGARRDRPLGPAAEAVLRRARARVPVRDGGIRRRDIELARAEVDTADP
mgnify:CR=1 FL=1